MDLISLPFSAKPASKRSKRKYSKLAFRLLATTLTFSGIVFLYYHEIIRTKDTDAQIMANPSWAILEKNYSHNDQTRIKLCSDSVSHLIFGIPG
jgi:hypothetical protein